MKYGLAALLLLLGACRAAPADVRGAQNGAQSGAYRIDKRPPREDDVCRGERRKPLDAQQLAQVRAAWEQLARGGQPAPLPLRAHSAGPCTTSWWKPVEPRAGCFESAPTDVWPLKMRAGTVIVHARSTPPVLAVVPPDDEVWFVDGHVVLRRWPISMRDARGALVGDGEIELLASTGKRHRLSGFPEYIVDDAHAIVRADPTMHLIDVRGTLDEARPGGRLTARTSAGVVEPPSPCHARLLSLLPPLLSYGDGAMLPADLVR